MGTSVEAESLTMEVVGWISGGFAGRHSRTVGVRTGGAEDNATTKGLTDSLLIGRVDCSCPVSDEAGHGCFPWLEFKWPQAFGLGRLSIVAAERRCTADVCLAKEVAAGRVLGAVRL